MNTNLNLYKPLGWTPLQVIDAYKDLHPEYQNIPMTYAGRLDPMAEGVLLVLVGDACKEKDDYLKLDKVYRAEIVFGLQTDTFDLLGIVAVRAERLKRIENTDLSGVHRLPIPPYSSVPVNGKPLFQWAREGRLDEIKIPVRDMTVLSSDNVSQGEISSSDLLIAIRERIGLVNGDFRQDEILSQWDTVLSSFDTFRLHTMTVDLHVISGTYIRALAHDFGGVLFSLKRLSVGDYHIKDSEILSRDDTVT